MGVPFLEYYQEASFSLPSYWDKIQRYCHRKSLSFLAIPRPVDDPIVEGRGDRLWDHCYVDTLQFGHTALGASHTCSLSSWRVQANSTNVSIELWP